MGWWKDMSTEEYRAWKSNQGEEEKSTYKPSEYDFSKLELIKKYPESREDVFDAYRNKISSHIMDAMKYCVDNKIPFLLWNNIIYDWHGNSIDCDYWFLPIKKK